MEDEFDVKKDYYQVLGVARSASADELKAAHIALALKLHPDMQTNQQQDNIDRMAREFGLVSEAWQVLSKPSLRVKYDSSRRRHLGLSGHGSDALADRAEESSAPMSAIPDSHHTQKANYNSFKKTQDSYLWRENRDKYKTEKWQGMPLHLKKLSRQQKVASVGGTVLGALVPAACFGAAVYAYFNYYYIPAGSVKDSQQRGAYGKR